MDEQHEALERSIGEALASGDSGRVATLVIEGYGDDLLGYLHARLRNQTYAEETFSIFAEDLWRSLPGLVLRSSMRAYVYTLARNAAHRYLDRDVRRERRGVPISVAPELANLVARTRTRTSTFQRTESKDAIARLRDRLTEDEQTLLTLRIDRGLEWKELAEVLAEGTDEDLVRATARLRKRFELVKKKLRRMAEEEGLLGS